MKRINYFLFTAMVLVISCQQKGASRQKEEKRPPQTAADPVYKEAPVLDSVQSDSVPQKKDTLSSWRNTPPLRMGKHLFTLHWISWKEPGSVVIKPSDDGWYYIEGEQRSRRNNDYITIQGGIRPISGKELLFRGTIVSRVATLNRGEPCERKGEQLFKATKNRKYWRLQNMENCEGNRLTDYIDIYF